VSDEDLDNRDLQDLLEYLKTSRALDLTTYKPPTLMRRILRRMQLVQVTSLTDYRDYLEVHPEEFNELFNTILINVTSFFRDAEAWAVLARDILPAIVSAKRSGGSIRVWSAGCASGEEAFTLALLCAEHLGIEEYRRRVKIYATDVDEDALAKARQATYDQKDLESVPAELRGKYFEKSNSRYTVRNELRRAVIFGRHDLVEDAPISHLDLLVCRNTLIYFKAETQGRILSRFHFALDGRGFLFLGKAEMLLSHASLFHPVDLAHRIFSKAPNNDLRDRILALAQTSDPETVNRFAKSVRLGEEAFSAMPMAQLVIDGDGTLVLANQLARRMFGLSPRDIGRPFHDLEVSYQPLELRSLIDRVRDERAAVRVSDVERSQAGGPAQHLDVELTPLPDHGGDLLGISIIFEDQSDAKLMQADLQRTSQELETAYEELQSTNEELETTNEELQSTVEELETTNEELQSTNEEHETMNEELQSTNEELQTINEQLRGRTAELKQANSLMMAIVSSLASGAVVVDRELSVLVWNRKAEELWGLRSSEVQRRPFVNLDIGLPVSKLLDPLRACLSGSAPSDVVVEATDRRGRSLRCRVTLMPLSGDGEIQGVIMLMEEVTGS
jgi:two-component system CheB/CheR fusion protein